VALFFLERLHLAPCKLSLLQELEREHWQQEELLLAHPARLRSALHGQANAAFFVLDGGEGLSARDRVNCTVKTPSACTDRVAMLPFESWLQRKASGFSFAQLY